jgi:hypothetical protein
MARSPLKKSIDLLSAGFEKRYQTRFNVQTSYQAIGKALPPEARVLMHETNINLGTGHTTVLDNPGWQYAIEYGAQKSPAEVHALLSSLGVTHPRRVQPHWGLALDGIGQLLGTSLIAAGASVSWESTASTRTRGTARETAVHVHGSL